MIELAPPLYQTSLGTPRDIGSLIAMESQTFGVNPALYAPLGLIGHNGLDWPCATGTPIHASHDGRATFSEDAVLYPPHDRGLGVSLQTDGFKTLYWHMDSLLGPLGTSIDVKRGDIIGYSGNSGYSSGPHLHLGLKLLDASGNVLNRNNGYDGAVDPTQYLVWMPLPSGKKPMDEIEIEAVQALEGYSDPTGAAYWAGVADNVKPYLIKRIQDKITQLQAVLAKLQTP